MNTSWDYSLKDLHAFGFLREQSTQAILQALRDENLNDPRERIEIAQSHVFYRPSLLGQSWLIPLGTDKFGYGHNIRSILMDTVIFYDGCCISHCSLYIYIYIYIYISKHKPLGNCTNASFKIIWCKMPKKERKKERKYLSIF